jgi:hypothetical protein
MRYDLWDTEVGKYLGRSTDEEDALATARTLVDHYGEDYAESLSICRVADDGTILDPLTGDALIVWLRAKQPVSPG